MTFSVLINACKKDNSGPVPVDTASSRQLILSDIATNVISATYKDFNEKSIAFKNDIEALVFSPDQINLNTCKEDWKALKSSWEQSKSFLFGPAYTDDVDNRLNTWPINYSSIDALIISTTDFTGTYVNTASGQIKGLQAIEYLLFGANGNKVASDLTNRELQYLNQLISNIKSIADKLATDWKTDSSVGYFKPFVYAGDGSSVYETQLSAYEKLVNSMVDIMNKIAGNDTTALFNLTNQNLEVTPCSATSLKHFKDNVQSVKNVYTGTYLTDAKGIEEFVSVNNTDLNGKIKQQLDESLASLSAITVPFGEAITTQAAQIQTAITKINVLRTTLKDELLPLIKTKIN